MQNHRVSAYEEPVMRRSAVLVPLLLLTLAPAAAAQEPDCGGSEHHVDTLSLSLPTAPATVRAGSTASVPVTVTRAGAPAVDVLVYLRLSERSAPERVTYSRGQTGADGRAEVAVTVPPGAAGSLQVTVEAFRPVVEVPCYGYVSERGFAAGDWGRAVR